MPEKNLSASSILRTIQEVDEIVAKVKNPKMTDVGRFVTQCATIISMQLNSREVKFTISERGWEVYNPHKAKRLH